MHALTIPSHPFKIEIREEKHYILGLIRKKFLVLTPEEWVRQHWIAYLHHSLRYPMGLISVEKEIKIGKVKKRYDLVIYDKAGKPSMLVECKAPNIKIGQSTLEQAARYNITIGAPFLLISNGIIHHCLSVDPKSHEIKILQDIPPFSS